MFLDSVVKVTSRIYTPDSYTPILVLFLFYALSMTYFQLYSQTITQHLTIQNVPVVRVYSCILTFYTHTIQQLTIMWRRKESVEPVDTKHFISASDKDMWYRWTLFICVYRRWYRR